MMLLARATDRAQREIYRAVYQMHEATEGRSRSEHLRGFLVPGDWGDVPDDFLTVTERPESALPPDMPYVAAALREAVGWEAVVIAHEGRCLYCGRADAELTIDHMEPRFSGGGHELRNPAPACRPCNSSKGKHPLREWLARRTELKLAHIVGRWERPGRGEFPA